MSIRLLVKQRGEEGGVENAKEVILNDPKITLGRDKGCQVVLAQQAVSRTHARISQDGPLFFLEDLGSAYGTEVNGEKLPQGEKRLLRNGDVIAIAQFDVVFDRVTEAPKEGGTDKTSFVARQVVKDVMRGLGSGEGPYFRIMNGVREGERVELSDAQELTFGRDETADLILKDDLVSRRHCKVRRDWSGTHVEDLESRNGIKVNRKRIKRKTLKDGDELEVGATRLLYLDPTEVREGPVVLPEEGNPTMDPGDSVVDSEPPSEQPSDVADGGSELGSDAASELDAGSQLGASEPPEEEPPPDEEPEAGEASEEEENAGRGGTGLMSKLPSLGGANKDQLVPLILMGTFGLVALIIVIALLVGA